MGTTSSLAIAASGLTAQRLRMDVVSSNLANAETTRTPDGGPYRRNRVVFSPMAWPTGFRWAMNRTPWGLAGAGGRGSPSSQSDGGVMAVAIVPDPTPFRVTYDPGHPDADEQGNVAHPNVDVATEITDMLAATRAYEANVTVVNAVKAMALKALEIGRG